METTDKDDPESPNLTIVMVEYENEGLVAQNVRLVKHLNPLTESKVRFLIVNNSDSKTLAANVRDMSPEIISGVERIIKGDLGSFHHAAALTKALKLVKTRYVLIMDPDFFVLPRHWIRSLLDTMIGEKLVCIASTWHPRWTFQPRYTATVHFMLLDLKTIALDQISLDPQLENYTRLRNRLYSFGLPSRLVKRLMQGAFRDTGCELVDLLQHRPSEVRLLTPIFEASRYYRSRSLLLNAVLTDALSLTPKRKAFYSTESFLQSLEPELYAKGCEEFLWNESPFAIHLRQVGRRLSAHEKNQEIDHLSESLSNIIAKINDPIGTSP